MNDRTYEVRIVGCLPDDVLCDLDDAAMSQRETRTLITCTLPDQAALHGFLQRLRTFGLDLVELRVVPPQDGAASGDDMER